jgi:uncharacterized SAM-binding protein YcdF (DUF218 family)
MESFLYELTGSILLPPLNLIILSSAGFVVFRSNPQACKVVAVFTLVLLYMMCTPYFVNMALNRYESSPRLLSQLHPQAIVVLGGGTVYTNGRLLQAARLYKRTQLPVLVTGGGPIASRGSEVGNMKVDLESDFNVPVKWVEGLSSTTYDNAIHTADMLRVENIHTIYLVTDAWHMPRAAFAFRKAGFEVDEYPFSMAPRSGHRVLAFLPDAESLLTSKLIMHEWIGLVWYKLAKY